MNGATAPWGGPPLEVRPRVEFTDPSIGYRRSGRVRNDSLPTLFMDTNALALLGASALTVIVGLARLVAWILDRRAEAALRVHREQVFIIESYVDLLTPQLQRRVIVSSADCEMEFAGD
ncbi:hypothetical protein P2C52_23215 [Xanthomonas perforans]